MRTTKLTIAVLCAGMWFQGIASAQGPVLSPSFDLSGGRMAAYDDSVRATEYTAEEMAEGEAAAMEAEGPPEPWKVPQPGFLQNLGIGWGGWIQQGITGNAANPPDRFNGPLATNDRSGEYQLNQAWIYFHRPTNTEDKTFDLGGHIDMSYGTDWRFGMNPGLENRINSADQFYGLVLPQFYLEVAWNDLSVKLGHYATGMGHEMVPAVGNFFYSHSYLMSYSEPLLVTGAEADYKLNDRLTLVGAFHRGWMMFEDQNDDFDFLGGVRWKSDDQRTGMSFLVDTGVQQHFFGEQLNRTVYAFVFTHKFNPTWFYALQYNHGWEPGGAVRPQAQGSDDAEWYGICQWLTYTLNPKLTLGGRFEWFRDDDGDRVAGVGGWIGSNKGWLGAPGFAGNFYELSLGVNWRPHPNFNFRPELRYDWYDGTRNIAGQLPFDAGVSRDQFTFAIDVVTTF